ncbi:hypothetical protein Belba_0509 [Belliella baltica DSM 15883]|uniref:Uncharacterized protein n=1 Tax=Belliella baltica (strain DSM 15883 / CIP 108006 / LMG 21964 / BA134) TaxID=866536 RepID=I3Z1P9_BELBD|nr:hypothetical protein Belba_0509 [Belliella baltica DSM 15883]
MSNFYCEYCGLKSHSVAHLTSGKCHKSPLGSNKSNHKLYEGSEKSQYTCKFCGSKSHSILHLTSGSCHRHPDGSNKGKHSPAL